MASGTHYGPHIFHHFPANTLFSVIFVIKKPLSKLKQKLFISEKHHCICMCQCMYI